MKSTFPTSYKAFLSVSMEENPSEVALSIMRNHESSGFRGISVVSLQLTRFRPYVDPRRPVYFSPMNTVCYDIQIYSEPLIKLRAYLMRVSIFALRKNFITSKKDINLSIIASCISLITVVITTGSHFVVTGLKTVFISRFFIFKTTKKIVASYASLALL